MNDRRALVLLVIAAVIVGVLAGVWLFDVLA
jgi:hypothetical protein